jgi:hypothetical protein
MGEIMNPDVSYRLALLRESMSISGQTLLIRLHLKTVSLEEYYTLKKRAAKVRELIRQTQVRS